MPHNLMSRVTHTSLNLLERIPPPCTMLSHTHARTHVLHLFVAVFIHPSPPIYAFILEDNLRHICSDFTNETIKFVDFLCLYGTCV